MQTLNDVRNVTIGDQIRGIRVEFSDGLTWSGEFFATYGDRRLTNFLADCDQQKMGAVYLEIRNDDSAPFVAMTYASNVYANERR